MLMKQGLGIFLEYSKRPRKMLKRQKMPKPHRIIDSLLDTSLANMPDPRSRCTRRSAEPLRSELERPDELIVKNY
jgi:hypothetical protein